MKLTIKKSEVLKALKSATIQEIMSLSSYGQTRYIEMKVKPVNGSKSRKKEPLAPGCCCADCLPGQLHLDLEEQCKK